MGLVSPLKQIQTSNRETLCNQQLQLRFSPKESRLRSYIGHSSNASLVLTLSVVCLRVCRGRDTGVMRVTHVLRRDIVSKRLLTFRITRVLLTQLLVLVEWEFS